MIQKQEPTINHLLKTYAMSTESVTAFNLKELAKGSDLKDMLIHSADELINDPSEINHIHALELINILSN